MLECYLLVLVFLLHPTSAPEACYISYTNAQGPSQAHWSVCDILFPVRHVSVWGLDSFRVVHALGSRDVGSGRLTLDLGLVRRLDIKLFANTREIGS